MPALPNVPRVVRYDFRQTIGPNARVLNRLFFQYSGTLSATDLATLLTTASASWNTNISPNLSTIVTMTSLTGTDLTSPSSPQAVNGTARVGGAGYQNLPAGTSIIIKFKINRRYRGGHPRVYFGGQGFANLADAEHWSSTNINAWNTGFAAFIAGCVLAPPAAVGTLVHVSVHYFAGFHNVTLPSGRQRALPTLLLNPSVDPVVSYSVNPIVGSQRRRNQQSA
jgi:hypothetical protein